MAKRPSEMQSGEIASQPSRLRQSTAAQTQLTRVGLLMI